MLNALFFICPFLFYIGIAIQGGAFYLICILLPMLILTKQKKRIPAFFVTLGSSLILLHILFPLTNFLVYFFPNKNVPLSLYTIKLTWPGIFKSDFSSSFFIGGLLIILLTYLNHKSVPKESQEKQNTNPLKFFLLGLFPASLFFCLLLLWQHCTGIDLRTHEKFGTLMTPDNRLANGHYRVFGFYGHPLTVAGVGLAYASFIWTLLWQFVAHRKKVNFDFVPFSEKKFIPEILLACIAITNAILIFLSAGRTAAMVCVAIFVFIPIFLNIKRRPLKTLLIVSVTFVFFLIIGKSTGVFNRIDITFFSIIKDHTLDTGNYRQYFWKVYFQMFKENPIFGQGNYWILEGVRDLTYDKMGYSQLPEKYIAHNNYLEILACVGLFGSVWILRCLYSIWKTLKNKILTGKLSYLLLPIMVMVIANLGHAFTQNVYFDSSVTYIYLEILFVMMWARVLKDESSKQSHP